MLVQLSAPFCWSSSWSCLKIAQMLIPTPKKNIPSSCIIIHQTLLRRCTESIEIDLNSPCIFSLLQCQTASIPHLRQINILNLNKTVENNHILFHDLSCINFSISLTYFSLATWKKFKFRFPVFSTISVRISCLSCTFSFVSLISRWVCDIRSRYSRRRLSFVIECSTLICLSTSIRLSHSFPRWYLAYFYCCL